MRHLLLTLALTAGCAHTPLDTLAPNEETYVAIPDVQGTTRYLHHAKQEVYTDPWGNSPNVETYTLPKHYQDQHSSPVHTPFGPRALLHQSHQWNSPDPSYPHSPEEYHPYAYSRQNPATLSDPSGLCTACEAAKDYAAKAGSVIYALSRIGALERIATETVEEYFFVKEPRVRVYLDPHTKEVVGYSHKEAWSTSWTHSNDLAKAANQEVVLQSFAANGPGKLIREIKDPNLKKIESKTRKSFGKKVDKMQDKIERGVPGSSRRLGGNYIEFRDNVNGGLRILVEVFTDKAGNLVYKTLAIFKKADQKKVFDHLRKSGVRVLPKNRKD